MVLQKLMPQWDLHLILAALPQAAFLDYTSDRLSDDILHLKWWTLKIITNCICKRSVCPNVSSLFEMYRTKWWLICCHKQCFLWRTRCLNRLHSGCAFQVLLIWTQGVPVSPLGSGDRRKHLTGTCQLMFGQGGQGSLFQSRKSMWWWCEGPWVPCYRVIMAATHVAGMAVHDTNGRWCSSWQNFHLGGLAKAWN